MQPRATSPVVIRCLLESARILAVRAYVAVTGRDWFRFLRDCPDLDEVNFWQPGGNRRSERKLGNHFLFKFCYPDNVIASTLTRGSVARPDG